MLDNSVVLWSNELAVARVPLLRRLELAGVDQRLAQLREQREAVRLAHRHQHGGPLEQAGSNDPGRSATDDNNPMMPSLNADSLKHVILLVLCLCLASASNKTRLRRPESPRVDAESSFEIRD